MLKDDSKTAIVVFGNMILKRAMAVHISSQFSVYLPTTVYLSHTMNCNQIPTDATKIIRLRSFVSVRFFRDKMSK